MLDPKLLPWVEVDRIPALVVPVDDTSIERDHVADQMAPVEQEHWQLIGKPEEHRVREHVPVEDVLRTEQERRETLEGAERRERDPVEDAPTSRSRHVAKQGSHTVVRPHKHRMAPGFQRLLEFPDRGLDECVPTVMDQLELVVP